MIEPNPTLLLTASPTHPPDVYTHSQCDSLIGQIAAQIRKQPVTIKPTAEVVSKPSNYPSVLKEDINCKHGLMKICCVICKEQNGELVDARSTAKAYTNRKRFKKDHPHAAPPPGLSDNEEASLRSIFDAKRVEPRFQQVTPEDVDWAERQTPFPHSQSMPRKATNFTGKYGTYLQQDGKPREGSTSSNSKNLAAGYQAKALQSWEADLKFQCEHPKKFDCNPFETKFLNGCVFVNSFQVWEEAGFPDIIEGTEAKRPERYVGKTLKVCARPGCEKVFTATRSTQKYCSKKCCNRQSEELKKENPCPPELLLETKEHHLELL